MFCLGHHISTLVSAERSSFLCGLCCPLLNDLFFTLRTPLHLVLSQLLMGFSLIMVIIILWLVPARLLPDTFSKWNIPFLLYNVEILDTLQAFSTYTAFCYHGLIPLVPLVLPGKQ